MKIVSGIYWDKGKRETNQDSLLLEQVVTSRGRVVLAAVSDGIGGLSEGETASGYIMETLLGNFYRQLLPLIGKGRGRRALQRSILRCFSGMNKALNEYGNSRELKLGATVSLLLIWRNHYLTAHLGDSRIYRLTAEGKSRRLTEDHSDGRNGLTRCMGSFPYQIPDISAGRIRRKTGFLLCSDGFYHFLSPVRLREMLGPGEVALEEQIEKRLRQLSEYAIAQGERDNISALYLVCGR